jgi:hypothetical protein
MADVLEHSSGRSHQTCLMIWRCMSAGANSDGNGYRERIYSASRGTVSEAPGIRAPVAREHFPA